MGPSAQIDNRGLSIHPNAVFLFGITRRHAGRAHSSTGVHDMTTQTLPIDRGWTRPRPIQRPVRLVLSAIAMWFIWVVPAVRLGRVLPAEVAGSPTFVAAIWMVFAALVV